MIYERPLVEVMCSAQAFWNQRIAQQFDEPAEMDWRARKIKEFVDTSTGRIPLSLSDICKRLALPMSGRQARRLFRNSMGMGFKEYVKKRHLVLAAKQLQATNIAIKEIALDAGYQTAQTFARRFKEEFFVTALEFRTLQQKKRATPECVVALPERPTKSSRSSKHAAVLSR